DTAQVLEGDTKTLCLRSRYNAFADYMVRMASKTGLLGVTLSKKSPGGKSAFGLQLRPQPPMPMPNALDGGPGVDVSCTVNGYVRYAQVYPKPAGRFTLRQFRGRNGGVEVE